MTAPSGPSQAGSPTHTVASEILTADLASVRWLDLLASDAIQANKGFSRAPSPSAELSPRVIGLRTGNSTVCTYIIIARRLWA